jgi:hypothetical protein
MLIGALEAAFRFKVDVIPVLLSDGLAKLVLSFFRPVFS